MTQKIYEKEVKTKYTGTPLDFYDDDKAWVIRWPRSLEHHHTYGKLTPFFKGLTEGKLLATRCINPKCPHNSTWLPPRADCPDCYEKMEWIQVPAEGKIYSYTMVEYAGLGIEMETPYWQIDIEIENVDTIFKSYLTQGKPYIGMPVKAAFRTENPSHTILDISWSPK